MSLIQDALSKTQNTVIPQPAKQTPPPQVQPRKSNIGGLQDFDREIERKIAELQKPQTVVRQKSYIPTLLVLLLGVVIVAGMYYWMSARTMNQLEPAPASVVDIQKSIFKSKPELVIPKLPNPVPFKEKILSKPSLQDIVNDFELSGIILGGDQPYALINGHIMREGDIVERDIKVSSIQKKHVELQSQSESAHLELRL